jgi:hypothetical protein
VLEPSDDVSAYPDYIQYFFRTLGQVAERSKARAWRARLLNSK